MKIIPPAVQKNKPNRVTFLLNFLSVLMAKTVLVESVLMHKTRHDIEHTNQDNLVLLDSKPVQGSDSSLCNSACNKISLSIGHKFIWRFDKNAQECKCLEAEKLDYFRYNEVWDHFEFIYDRKSVLISECGSLLFVPPPA